MPTENPPPRPLNTLNLTIVSLERFFYVMQTIAEGDLWDEVEDHLKSRACHSIAISWEPIEAMKGMLRSKRAAEIADQPGAERTGTDARIDTFVACACGVPPTYPPRPPDDWPEGPWDPPQLME